MQLEEEATGVAQHGAGFIAAPERGGAGGAVLADRLCVVVSPGDIQSGGWVWVMRAILSYRLSIRIRSSNSAGGRDDMVAPSHNNTLKETYRRVALSAGGCGRSGRVGHAEAMGGFAGGGQYQRAQKWRCRCRRQAYCFAISATAGGEHHHRSLPARAPATPPRVL